MVHGICAFAVLFDFRLFDLSLSHTCFWRALYLVLLVDILRRLDPFDCAIVIFVKKTEVIGLHDFRSYLHVASQSLTTLYCILFRLNSYSIASYVCPWKDKIWNIPWTCCLLTLHIVTPDLAVWLGLFANKVCCFLSRTSYLPSSGFVRDWCNLTSSHSFV